jgi:RNA polymerase sigma-70 factor, ECF subfamily
MNLRRASDSSCGASDGLLWTRLVERIRQQDSGAMEELYQVFLKGARFLLYRQLGPRDLEDKVHDLFVMVTQSICNGELRQPERLMGYVRTVVRRQVVAHIEDAVRARRNYRDLEGSRLLADREPDPERSAIERQQEELAFRILNVIAKRDREVLVRFYLEEEPVEEICRQMHLTRNQFRLIKSRAKARFGELGRRRLARRTGSPVRSPGVR